MIAGVLAVAGVTVSGWLQPQFGVTYRPEALPRDQYAYGVGPSQAGVMVFGEPVDNFHYMIHLFIGGDTSDKPISVEQATASWEPNDNFSLAVGRMRIPYSAQAFAIQTTLMFPSRSGPNEVFLPGTDLGALATVRSASLGLVASAGIWNGTGQEAGTGTPTDRGFLYSGRVDWTFGGDFPFDEGDLGRGPFRFGLGAAAVYRQSLSFDVNGFPGAESQDLRLSVSARLAVRGFYLQAEALRRQTDDNLSSVTRGATGAYVQSSYYFLVNGVGLSPVARAGWARQDENFNEREIDYLDGGFAVYPHGDVDHPEALRFMLLYSGEWRTTEGEEAHRVALWVQLIF